MTHNTSPRTLPEKFCATCGAWKCPKHQTTPTGPAGPRKEATMARHPLSPSTLARLGISEAWASGRSSAKVLEAAGHPGYGEAFARRALELVEAGHGTHQAVYGLMGR